MIGGEPDPDAETERGDLATLIQAQAALVELAEAEPAWTGGGVEARIQRIWRRCWSLNTR